MPGMDEPGDRPGRLHVGTSGYHYPEWCGRHYPAGTPASRFFAFYAEMFDTVEVNNTFYGVPAESVFDAWRERAPEGFTYAIKVNREITHRKRLAGAQAELAEQVRRAERLGDHLGPFLVQLPPRWPADPERLDAFLATAAGLGDHRWAVEAREPSWRSEAVLEVLHRHGAALVLHDLPGGSLGDPEPPLTAGWTYLRFHGPASEGGPSGTPGETYAGSYGPRRLAAHAAHVAAWLGQGLDVHAYFNNTKDGNAVTDALALRAGVVDEARSPSAP
jgi:uncharacterized protein YecE (DUF72 family)